VQLLVTTPVPRSAVGSRRTVDSSSNSGYSGKHNGDASIGTAFLLDSRSASCRWYSNVSNCLVCNLALLPPERVLGARRRSNNITLDGADRQHNQNSGLIAQATGTAQVDSSARCHGREGECRIQRRVANPATRVRVSCHGGWGQRHEGRSSGGTVCVVPKEAPISFTARCYNTTAIPSLCWPTPGSPTSPAFRSTLTNQFAVLSEAPSCKNRSSLFFNYNSVSMRRCVAVARRAFRFAAPGSTDVSIGDVRISHEGAKSGRLILLELA